MRPLRSAAGTTAPAATRSTWIGQHVDLNLLVVLGILGVLAARHVGIAKLAVPLRDRLQPLAQTPGGVAFGIIIVLLAFTLCQRPPASTVPPSPAATGEREVLHATIVQKTNELKQLSEQLAPGEAAVGSQAGDIDAIVGSVAFGKGIGRRPLSTGNAQFRRPGLRQPRIR